jgi:PhzF family phenazine biosynthesis protein
MGPRYAYIYLTIKREINQMTKLPLYQIDAFASAVFKGNPAAVVPLQEWLPDGLLQKIALENNLSETAFFTPTSDGFHVRWFTPAVEVALCGHATLATAYVIFEKLKFDKPSISFESKSGKLSVAKTKDGLELDFPIWGYTRMDVPPALGEALGCHVQELYRGHDWVAVLADEQSVQSLNPDLAGLAKFEEARGIVATAPGSDGIDFVSRWFGPRVGVPEDPVTGSAHCILAPVWSAKTGKTKFRARQVSARGGDVICEIRGDRVHLIGQAVLYKEAFIYV